MEEKAEAKPEVKEPAEAKSKVKPWLLKNRHYQERMRLKIGDLVILAGDENQEGILRPGEVGKLLSDDRSDMPFEVAGPRGDKSWYQTTQLTAAPKGPEYTTAQAVPCINFCFRRFPVSHSRRFLHFFGWNVVRQRIIYYDN